MVKWLDGQTAADVNYINSEVLRYTPLAAAFDNDYFEIVKYLIQTCHADVNLLDYEGYTPITWACGNVRKSALFYFLREVSDRDGNIAHRYGNNAIHYVVWCSKDDNTQLHEACVEGDETEVLRLVRCERPYKINVQNNDGDTSIYTELIIRVTAILRRLRCCLELKRQ